ncbi:transposase [Phytohabitans sp. ZYX-F-186]|uniref:Transposase n=1 Tax=Phytohabitans maris TaxID=3071409 RepID=A0ABU0ZVM0_9ACTN|nr:transposase [Phytohabitans sp. ZYX-F-186]MDQ7911088.1 transposase [Phytohabitans sp. ZYX-F-186]
MESPGQAALTSRANGWAVSARRTMASSWSPPSGPTNGSTIRCTPALTRRPLTSAKGATIPRSAAKLQVAAELVTQAQQTGVVFHAVVADCFYGDYDDLRGQLRQAGFGFVMALKPHRGTWQYGTQAHTPKDAAKAVPYNGPDDPGRWHPVQRRFRDGHTETWWATDAQLGWWSPDGHTRLVIATKRPATLPNKATRYLASNLPRPGGPHDTSDRLHESADLTEVVRLYGVRHWIEQSYKQVKDELGWAAFTGNRSIFANAYPVLRLTSRIWAAVATSVVRPRLRASSRVHPVRGAGGETGAGIVAVMALASSLHSGWWSGSGTATSCPPPR